MAEMQFLTSSHLMLEFVSSAAWFAVCLYVQETEAFKNSSRRCITEVE